MVFYAIYQKGKSLSLICGALKWLVDSEERDKAKIEAVLAGKLPTSALEESAPPSVATSNGCHVNSEHGGGSTTDATGNTTATQGKY